MAPTSIGKVTFVSSGTDDSEAAREQLVALYGDCGMGEAETIVALGGDGFMLETLHRVMDRPVPVYGINFGSVGFMMNDFAPEKLAQRLAAAERTEIHPLTMAAILGDGTRHQGLALNEVSLLRSSYQAAKLRILIDDHVRMDELICDGILLATPAGSTAYNLSAHGPILPITAQLLALTPISPFRPRRWRGALLANTATVKLQILDAGKRPVNAVADNLEFENVVEVEVREDRTHSVLLLFDPGHSLDERVLAEQFVY
ncbi:MAG: NAD kinase [Alphaproteobacteria bacterium]|nr:NAD kinase [Alphaproteobacteria bacterium]